MASITPSAQPASTASKPVGLSEQDLSILLYDWNRGDTQAINGLALKIGETTIEPKSRLGSAIMKAVGGKNTLERERLMSEFPRTLTVDIAVKKDPDNAALVFVPLEGVNGSQVSLENESFQNWLKGMMNTQNPIRVYTSPQSKSSYTSYYGKSEKPKVKVSENGSFTRLFLPTGTTPEPTVTSGRENEVEDVEMPDYDSDTIMPDA